MFPHTKTWVVLNEMMSELDDLENYSCGEVSCYFWMKNHKATNVSSCGGSGIFVKKRKSISLHFLVTKAYEFSFLDSPHSDVTTFKSNPSCHNINPTKSCGSHTFTSEINKLAICIARFAYSFALEINLYHLRRIARLRRSVVFFISLLLAIIIFHR